MAGCNPAIKFTNRIALKYEFTVPFHINQKIPRCTCHAVDSNGTTIEFQIDLATVMKIQSLGDHGAIEHRKLCPHSALDAKVKPTGGAKIDRPRIRDVGLSIRMAAKNHTSGSQNPIILNGVNSTRL